MPDSVKNILFKYPAGSVSPHNGFYLEDLELMRKFDEGIADSNAWQKFSWIMTKA